MIFLNQHVSFLPTRNYLSFQLPFTSPSKSIESLENQSISINFLGGELTKLPQTSWHTFRTSTASVRGRLLAGSSKSSSAVGSSAAVGTDFSSAETEPRSRKRALGPKPKEANWPATAVASWQIGRYGEGVRGNPIRVFQKPKIIRQLFLDGFVSLAFTFGISPSKLSNFQLLTCLWSPTKKFPFNFPTRWKHNSQTPPQKFPFGDKQTDGHLQATSPAHVVSTSWIPKRYHECSSNQPDNVHLPRPGGWRSVGSHWTTCGWHPVFLGCASSFSVHVFLSISETFSPLHAKKWWVPESSNLYSWPFQGWTSDLPLRYQQVTDGSWVEVGFFTISPVDSYALRKPGSLKRHTFFFEMWAFGEITPIFFV